MPQPPSSARTWEPVSLGVRNSPSGRLASITCSSWVELLLFSLFFAEPLVRIFTGDPVVVPIGVACLRYVSYSYGFCAYGMVIVQAFNGAGDTATPTTINLFCYWLFEIPLAYALAIPARLGVNGVFLAITIAEST